MYLSCCDIVLSFSLSLCSKGLADNTVIAKVSFIIQDTRALSRTGHIHNFFQVNGVLWDLDRPLEGDCSLELLKFEDDLGKWMEKE